MMYQRHQAERSRTPDAGRRPAAWARGGWARRTAIAGGAVVAVMIAVFAVATAVLFWRLADGPIALDSLQPTIEGLFDDQVGGGEAEIGRVWLENDAEKGLVVRLDQVRILDGAGRQVVSAPEAAMGTSLFSALTGSLNPTSVELIGPHIRVRRHADGRIELGFAESAPRAASPKEDAGQFVGQAAPTVQALAPRRPTPKPGVARPQGAQPQSAQPESAPAAAAGSGAAEAPIQGPAFSPVSLTLGGGDGFGAIGRIQSLTVSRARLTVYDDAAGGSWESFGAEFHITRPDGGLRIDVDAPFQTDSGEWRIRAAVVQPEADAMIGIEAEFDAVIPSEIAARSPELAFLAGLDLPVTGKLSASVSPDLRPERMAVDLRFGAGFVSGAPGLGINFAPTLVDEGHVELAYFEAEQRLDIGQIEVMLGGDRIRVTGTASPERDASGQVNALRFNLRSEGLRLGARDLARPPLDISRGLATGRMIAAPAEIEIETLSLEFADGGSLAVGGNIGFGRNRRVDMQGQIESISLDNLLQLWPRVAAPGARAWIAEKMPKGRLSDGRLAIRLEPEDFARRAAGEPFPNDKVQVEFALEDITVHYLGDMPPIREAFGIGLMEGDRFRISMRGGRVTTPAGAELKIESGRFAIPALAVEKDAGYAVGQIDVSVSGPLSGALEVLDMEPLGWAREMGVVPAETGGEAEINLDIELPLLSSVQFSQTRIQAGARLTNLTAPDLFENVDVEGGELTIIATQRQIDAAGKVVLSGIDSDLKWNAVIDAGGRRTDRISLTGLADENDLKAFGVNLEGYVSGKMPITLQAKGLGADISEATIEADITPASVSAGRVGWRKEVGAPGTLSLELQKLDNGQVRLRNIRVEGKDMVVLGAIRLDEDGSLFKADLERIRLGNAVDVALSGVRGADGVLRLKVNGRQLDSRAVLDGLFSGGTDETGGGGVVEADFNVASVRGRNDTDIQNVRGKLRVIDGEVAGLNLDGVFASGQPITVAYGKSGARPAKLNLKTGDAGGFARLMGIYRRAFGGALTLDARTDGNGRLDGVARARNFRIRGEPVLQQLGSSQGIGNVNDVAFSEFQMRFQTNGERIDISYGILNGPSMGARVDGWIDTDTDQVSVNGTFVPAYGLNSIPAGIPLVGWLLTGRAGEGVVGMTFRAEGDMADPRVHINPLSPLAPGILRSLFEFRGR